MMIYFLPHARERKRFGKTSACFSHAYSNRNNAKSQQPFRIATEQISKKRFPPRIPKNAILRFSECRIEK